MSIEDSFLWDNVIVEDSCHINKSILADNVTLKKHSRVKQGSVLASNVSLLLSVS